MEINVSQQLKALIGNIREYEIDEIADVLGSGLKIVIKGSVKLTRTHRGILAQGNFKTGIPVECSRCLRTFIFPLTVTVEEEYFPVIDVNTGNPLELPDETGSFSIDEHHILDLREAIRQNTLLAVPMKPLCRQDCAGLCQQCGKDLNEGPCDCPKETIDPRWARLVQLSSTGKNKKK
ncbi:MAG: DUF177 domain-containing protein [Dehalococcoidales bacterium]|nr:DUF177 domain-containing protein [Dehalococcoidales bacterium]